MDKNSNIIIQKKIPKVNDYKIESQDENLCKKYFFINKNIISSKFKTDNIYKLLDKLGENFFQEVNKINNKSKLEKSKLEKTKINCIRTLILNSKQIPENWITSPLYRELLAKAMRKNSILKFAIINKEFHKKSTLNSIDEEEYEKYLNESKNSQTKITISNTSRYNRYITKSPIKSKIIKEIEYCQSVNYKNRNIERIIINNSNNLDGKLYKKIDIKSIQNLKRQNFPKILKLKKLKQVDDNEKNDDEEIKEELTLTSFYYTGINKKSKNISDHKNDNNKNNNRNCIELPKII